MERPPRKKSAGTENPPVAPEVQEQVQEMRSEAKELHFSLLEGMKEKGLAPEQIGDLWERAVILNKSLTDTIDKFRKSKDPEDQARLQAYFEEAKNNLEHGVIPEILNFSASVHEEESVPTIEEPEESHDVEPAASEAEPVKHEEPRRMPDADGVYDAEFEDIPQLPALRLTDLEKPESEDLTPKERKGKLRSLLGKKTKKPRAVPHSFTESEPELVTEPEAEGRAEEVSDRSASEMRTHARVLALETRGPEAMQKLKDAFSPYDPNRATGAEARTTVEMAEKGAPYSEKMYVAEKTYLDALKSHHQKRGALSMVAEQFVKHKEPKEVRELRDAWVAARAEYAGFLNQSAKERYVEKDGAFNKEQSVLDRYQRMVVAREVVLGAEEAEQRAKMEGLSKREQGALDKAFEAYKKLPPGVRILGTAALFTGGAALAAGGGAIAAVPLALGGTSAALRWYAEAKGSKAAAMLSRLTSVGAIAGLVGEYGTRAVHAALGTEEKAAETIQQRELRTGSGKAMNLGDAANLASLSRSREQALGAAETVQRHSRVARFLSSVTGGALFGHAMHDAASAPSHDVQVPSEPAAPVSPFGHEAPFRESSIGYQPMSADDLKHVYHAEDSGTHHDAAPSHEAQHATPHVGHRTHLDHSSRADTGHAPEAAPVVHLTEEDRNLIQEWEIKNGGLPPHSDEHITEVLARLRENNGPDAFKDVHFEAVHHTEAAPAEAPAPEAPEEPQAPEAAPPAPEPTPEPVHEAPPPPEAPVHHEAPATHEAQPVHEAPAHVETSHPAGEATSTDTHEVADSSVMNTHGLLIDRQAPHIYADDKNNLIVHGGTEQQQADLRKAFLADPKNFGKPLFMVTATPDPITGKPDVVTWITDMRGRVEYKGILADDNNVPYAPPTENDFIKKVF